MNATQSMHVCKSRFLVRGEVWYDHEPEAAAVDWIFYRQRSRPVPGTRWSYFYTILLDLSKEPDELLRQMNKTTAYNIRRSRERDQIRCECADRITGKALEEFERMYGEFARLKGLGPLDWPSLSQLAGDGCLELSFARDPAGKPLVCHAYYRDGDRSCLLHTVSLYQELSDSAARNAIARANRGLFWFDILRHQAQGLKVFDFGGWYPGSTDQDRLDINQFKEGFGGKVVREYNCEQIITLKGKVVLMLAAALNWATSAAARLRSATTRREEKNTAAEAQPRAAAVPRVGQIPILDESEMAK